MRRETNVHKQTKGNPIGKHVDPLKRASNNGINNICPIPTLPRQFREKLRHCGWCNEVTGGDLCVKPATPCPMNMDMTYKSDLPKHLRIHQRENSRTGREEQEG